ncbi:nitroreductase family deazaflavin-dependent oxidoreductase [Microbispora sp. ATCC PTA-5024]|uniref:nitroreductase family deazaflavin-dependent oxidoreductase n=1 Tax=Microbispora sp. ATCC PTA-5024 TaxID=316330 RepID=UPI0003DD1C41|nr:nitroreductase family deazaflavin-dependent oxidoreductase [Microbispora sp. ATCC PTA-5024]ETK32782.1 hypothetical protein MPTA5024_27910 [Microbispora sp. ATCC PTA-5024]
MGLIDHRPRRLLRRALRMPLWLYRHDLGWLLGTRVVYLATRGRRTGLRRETVLEVVGLNRAAGTVYVVSGWGARSDWYRNLLSAPALEIRLGRRRLQAPRHRFLDAEECRSLLIGYRARHPYAWKVIAPMLGFPADPSGIRGLDRVRAVSFSPASRPTPYRNDDEPARA